LDEANQFFEQAAANWEDFPTDSMNSSSSSVTSCLRAALVSEGNVTESDDITELWASVLATGFTTAGTVISEGVQAIQIGMHDIEDLNIAPVVALDSAIAAGQTLESVSGTLGRTSDLNEALAILRNMRGRF
jgi:hypothetical protein